MPAPRKTKAGLTDQIIRETQPQVGKRVELQDNDPSQLWLRVTEKGTKTFAVRYRIRGQPLARLTLGSYPDLRLSEARALARRALSEVRLGNDPTPTLRPAKTKPQGPLWRDYLLTFEANVVRDKVKRGKWGEIYAANLRSVLTYNTKDWADRPLDSITQSDVATRLVEIKSQSVKHSTFQYLRLVFNRAIHDGLLTASPIGVGFQKPDKTGSRDRVLRDGELIRIWKFVTTDKPKSVRDRDYNRIVALLTVTGQRLREVAHMSWSEVDLDAVPAVWIIPASRAKNKRAHVVPLTELARWLIAQVEPNVAKRSGYLFPRESNPNKPFDSFSEPKLRLDKMLEHTVSDWTLHDLRRTCSTWLNTDNRAHPHIVEALLNHTIKGIAAATYNRATYTTEILVALDKWSAHLIALWKMPFVPLSDATLGALDPKSRPAPKPIVNPLAEP
jgi:integrase